MAIALGASGPSNFKLGASQALSIYQGSDLVWELPFIDAYGPFLGAYSVRLLNPAYTGPCLTVRNSAGTNLDIGFDANGDLDTAAILSFIGVGDGVVHRWYDQSGLGLNLNTGFTFTSKPLIVSAGVLIVSDFIYNKPAIQIDSARYFTPPQFFSTSIDDLASFRVISRWTQGTPPTSWQNQYIYYPGNATSFWESLQYDNPAALGIRHVAEVDRGAVGGAKTVYSAALTNQRSYVIGTNSSLSDLEIWTDGVQSMTVADGTGTIPPPATSGRLVGGGNLSASRLSEWILIQRDMSPYMADIALNMMTYYKT